MPTAELSRGVPVPSLPRPEFSNIHPGYAGSIVLIVVPFANVVAGTLTVHVVSPERDAIWLTTTVMLLGAFFLASLVFDLEE
jgi:hypothetical protein